MNISVSPRSPEPIYQQIYDQIAGQIMRGELAAGYGLPPIRTAARELRISVITVKKAWEMLEHEGLIYSVVGRGCFVENLTGKELADRRTEKVLERVRSDVQFYRRLGLGVEEVVELVRRTFAEERGADPV